jgi:hypothetical protein
MEEPKSQPLLLVDEDHNIEKDYQDIGCEMQTGLIL